MHVVGGIILSLQINDFTFFCGCIPLICFISPLIRTRSSPQARPLPRPCPLPPSLCLSINGADGIGSAGRRGKGFHQPVTLNKFKKKCNLQRKWLFDCHLCHWLIIQRLNHNNLTTTISKDVWIWCIFQLPAGKYEHSSLSNLFFIILIIQLSWSKSLRRSSGQGSAVLLTAISNSLPHNSLWDPDKRIGSALLRQVRLDFTGGITAFHFLSLERLSEVPHKHNDVLSVSFFTTWAAHKGGGFRVIKCENKGADVHAQSLENACWETAQKRPHTGYVDAGEDIYSEAIAPHTKACTLERVDEAFHGCQCFCLSALGKTVFENAFNYSLFFLSLHFRLNCDAWRPQAEDWLEANTNAGASRPSCPIDGHRVTHAND